MQPESLNSSDLISTYFASRGEMSEEKAMSRRESLQAMVEENPGNTFARYGLAMELTQTEPAAAWAHFNYLLDHHPEYAATYYQAGAFLVKQGKLEEAREVLTKGVEVAGRQGNRHAQSELQAALDDLNDSL